MPCYKPLKGWRSTKPNDNGKFPVIFTYSPATKHYPEVDLPCGRCIGCRLEYSRQWAMRIMHETTLHPDYGCSFITLTYDPEHLPADQSLDKRDWQLFLKKLRAQLDPKKIRFFMSGEYGQDQELLEQGIDSLGRPHFHAIIFGHDFPDRKQFSKSPRGDVLYTSELLDKTWGKGFASVGDVTFESAAYVARYVVKKITGDAAFDRYAYFDEETGEMFLREPEFCLMSRRPGIARDWFNKYKSDLDKGFITHHGVKMQPPKFYDKLFEELDPELFKEIKKSRLKAQKKAKADNTPERLAVKETIKTKKLKTLKRKL